MDNFPEKVTALIPARYASSRFPGKLLARIKDRTILHHVYAAVSQCHSLHDYAIVLDDDLLETEAKTFGAKYLRSTGSYNCGTDRCIAASSSFDGVDILVNVQADQPFISPAVIDQLVHGMRRDKSILIASLMTEDPCKDEAANVVKVYVDDQNIAEQFSRSLQEDRIGYRHIGVYAFRKKAIDLIRKMEPTTNETLHHLEQLRWLDNGMKISMIPVDYTPVSIDIPEDLEDYL